MDSFVMAKIDQHAYCVQLEVTFEICCYHAQLVLQALSNTVHVLS